MKKSSPGFGAQGGRHYFINEENDYDGNRGSYGADAIIEMTITVEERTFYAYVEGQGKSGPNEGEPNEGGWNCCVRSGRDAGYSPHIGSGFVVIPIGHCH